MPLPRALRWRRAEPPEPMPVTPWDELPQTERDRQVRAAMHQIRIFSPMVKQMADALAGAGICNVAQARMFEGVVAEDLARREHEAGR